MNLEHSKSLIYFLLFCLLVAPCSALAQSDIEKAESALVNESGDRTRQAIEFEKQGKSEQARNFLKEDFLKLDISEKLKAKADFYAQKKYLLAQLYLGNDFANRLYRPARAEVILDYLLDENSKKHSEAHPKSLSLALDMVLCYIELGKDRQAIDLLKHIIGKISFKQKFFLCKAHILRAGLLRRIRLQSRSQAYTDRQAYLSFDRALRLADDIVDPNLINLLDLLGGSYADSNDFLRSAKAYEMAVDKCKSIYGPKQKGLEEIEMKLSQVKQQKDNRATSTIDEVLELLLSKLKELPDDKKIEFADKLRRKAKSYMYAGKYLEAEPAMSRAIELYGIIKKPLHKQLVSKVLGEMAEVYEHLNKFKKSENMYKRAIDLWKTKEQKIYAVDTMFNYRTLLNRQRRVKESLELAEQIKIACDSYRGLPPIRTRDGYVRVPRNFKDKVTYW